MKWIGRRASGNIEDRRRMPGGKIAIGGGAIGLIIILINLFLGGDTSQLTDLARQQLNSQQANEITISPEEDEMARFVAVALADNEDVWKQLFGEMGLTYEEPKVVLFRDAVESACGNAGAATGPFYCPSDKKVYIDLSFFDELKNRFGAKGGDFAIAYVLAHEIGHHVQNLLGTSGKVESAQRNTGEKAANRLSVALELQADFYAGVWAHHDEKKNQVLEEGDIAEALSAASAVGDDHLQKMTRGQVVPDAFTHGTSEQRMYWFKKGFETGDISKGDTFSEISN